MKPRLTTNSAVLWKRMQKRREVIVRELERAAVLIGARLSAAAKKVMQEQIYDVPIPLRRSSDRLLARDSPIRKRTTKGRHGQWFRTGNLKRSEGWRVEGTTIILANNAIYSAARHALGSSRSSRKIRSRGVRSVQWQTQAIRENREEILRIQREAVVRTFARR